MSEHTGPYHRAQCEKHPHKGPHRDLPRFQRSEFLLKSGLVDRVVPRQELRTEIARIIDYSGR